VVLASLVVLAVGAIWAASTGHVSIDEGVLHLMTRDTAGGHPFDLHTGWGTYRSDELLHIVPGKTAHTQVVDGRVVGQYPFLFPALAAALYGGLGAGAMIAVNVVASAMALGVAAALASRWTGRRGAGIVAAVLLGVGGYWLDYTYAMWPHVAATSAWLGGVALAWGTDDEAPPPRRAIAAGLCLGAAWCIRLDAAVLAVGTLAVMGLPGRATPTPRWRPTAWAAIGLAVPVAVLSATHLAKFGTLDPLSYGVDVDTRSAGVDGYRGLVAIALAGLAALAIVGARPAVGDRSRRTRAIAALVTVAVVALWQAPTILAVLGGARALVFDLALIDDAAAETTRLPTGTLVYGGAIKKALVQSCPHLLAVLALAVGPFVEASPERRRRLAMLVLPVLGLTAVFCLRSWHGGASINMRYFVPWLPVLAILGAVAAVTVADAIGPRRSRIVVVVAAMMAIAATAGALTLVDATPDVAEPWVRFVPLAASIAALLAVLVWLRAPGPGTATTLAILLAAAAAWSVGIGIADLAWTHRARSRHAAIGAYVADRIDPGALVIAQIPAPLYGLLRSPDVLLASAASDRGADMGRLARRALADGRPVYFVFVAGPAMQAEIGSRLPELRFEIVGVEAGLALIRAHRP
jgi:hypothetical protein